MHSQPDQKLNFMEARYAFKKNKKQKTETSRLETNYFKSSTS